MLNVSKIQANLYGVVGCRQPHNPAYAKLDAVNQITRSGYYATDNPYAKIEYLYDNIDYKDLTDIEFNEKLKQMQEESIISVCGHVFNKPDYIDRQVLYPHAQNRVESEILDSGLITHKITLDIKKNLAFEISRIMLDFEGAGDINIMLFNTSDDTPLFTELVTITSTHQEVVLNWKVDNSGDTYKGDYYLGYRNNTAGIGTLKPFKRNYENSNIESIITHVFTEKLIFKGHATDTLPDLRNEDGISEATGLNPDITVYDDYTDLIIQNEMLFAKAINYDLQINFLSHYLASLRSNRNERNSENITLRVLQEIEGQSGDNIVTITGLRPLLSRAISSITQEIKKINEGYFGNELTVITMI